MQELSGVESGDALQANYCWRAETRLRIVSCAAGRLRRGVYRVRRCSSASAISAGARCREIGSRADRRWPDLTGGLGDRGFGPCAPAGQPRGWRLIPASPRISPDRRLLAPISGGSPGAGRDSGLSADLSGHWVPVRLDTPQEGSRQSPPPRPGVCRPTEAGYRPRWRGSSAG